jgi:hypothetical protein
MRVFLVALLVCAGVLFFGCSDDPEAEGIGLSSDNITLWVETDTVVTIAGPVKAYTVTSSNEDVARVSISDNSIRITTDHPGQALIQVADEGRVAEIRVRASSFDGVWRRMPGQSHMDPEIVVEAGNAAFADELKDQLRLEVEEQLNNMYWIMFSEGDGSYQERERAKPVREGLFTYRNNVLTLDEEEVYAVTIKSLKLIALTRDLTEVYRQQYPDMDVKRVTVMKYFHFYTLPG